MSEKLFTPDDDLLLFERVKELIRSYPQAFQEAGCALDDPQNGYSDAGVRHRTAKLKFTYYMQGREKRQHNTEFCTQAAWRKLYGKHGVPHSDMREKGADGRFHRIPLSKAERFRLAWSETLDQLDKRPLDRRVQADRHAMATRVILLTWLQVDPDADTFKPVLTDFQDWPWDRDWSALEEHGVVMWTPDGHPMPTADRVVSRHDMREKLLDQECPQRAPLVRRAIELVMATLQADAAAVTPSITKHTQKRRKTTRKKRTRKSPDDLDYQPGSWFTQNTKVKLTTLRKAAGPKRKTKRVRSCTKDGVKCYSASDARRWWPHDMEKA